MYTQINIKLEIHVWISGLKEGDIIDAVDVRIKQTGDNRYIGIMACEVSFLRLNYFTVQGLY